MTVTTTDLTDTGPSTVLTATEVGTAELRATAEVRASAFPRQAAEYSPNLATLDMLRSTGRNPLLLRASRRTRLSRQRDCRGTSNR